MNVTTLTAFLKSTKFEDLDIYSLKKQIMGYSNTQSIEVTVNAILHLYYRSILVFSFVTPHQTDNNPSNNMLPALPGIGCGGRKNCLEKTLQGRWQQAEKKPWLGLTPFVWCTNVPAPLQRTQ